jgi:ubiquinone/menaquinone biosynthesis C-methylase UbiE
MNRARPGRVVDAADITPHVSAYWNAASCGTSRVAAVKHSPEYFAQVEEFRYRHEPYIHAFAQFTRWRGRRILEMGVGAGTDLLQFARAGARVSGVDLTPEAIDNARAVLALHGLKAEHLGVANGEHLPYPDEFFDLVYSWGVIHHANQMEKALHEIVRVTKRGGRVKVMVYNRAAVHAWYMYGRYGVARGRLAGGRAAALRDHQESFGTKAYTRREVERMLVPYRPQDLRFSFWDQLIRPGARFARPRRWLQRLTPASMRWYMGFEFDRPA